MAREKILDNNVISYIKDQGGWCLKYWGGSKFTKNGIPDILACIDGQFFAIEDKAEHGKPSLLQIKTLKKIRKAYGFGILLYPNDFENFKRFVAEILDHEELTDWQKEWYQSNIDLQNKWEKKLENF